MCVCVCVFVSLSFSQPSFFTFAPSIALARPPLPPLSKCRLGLLFGVTACVSVKLSAILSTPLPSLHPSLWCHRVFGRGN